MANINDEKLEMKVVILGNSGSGKTSIVHRYVEKIFNDYTSVTRGESYSSKQINIKDKSIKLNIWDISETYGYSRLNLLFFKDADAIILVPIIT